ncbi:hypothetical protein GUITHDRAFT_152869 [Guillardia theta CCMP2712]|uniref:Cyclic nucleotide-binding domain-containing protein n=2 Tax=Guillardia theta TaxID=55529 RepID=L1J943_GUITC|nr:hypothetical protein GUITHDRAFT_152869 [Guillardia theta CCMP2712]EKX44817.1 hypothetical protein GUITHDRAFT_152869 [Guillardia theta CCMP2712]|eukprot:XP_005831797.1 hypothetical protein GUITHDRAFT_152869 [Guillardia theta CCMP2712]
MTSVLGISKQTDESCCDNKSNTPEPSDLATVHSNSAYMTDSDTERDMLNFEVNRPDDINDASMIKEISEHLDLSIEEKMDALMTSTAVTARHVDVSCVRLIAKKMKTRVVEKDALVMKRGCTGRCMYWVVRGSCVAFFNGQCFEPRGRGQCFGEVAVVNVCNKMREGVTLEEAIKTSRRMTDVVALEQTVLIELDAVDALPLVRTAPNLWRTLEDLAKFRVNRVKVASEECSQEKA